MKTRLTLFLCAILMLSSFASSVKYVRQSSKNKAVQKQSVQPRNAGNNAARPQAGGRGFQTVKVTGKGESLELAREDAKRNALAQVVGEAIKARTDITENGDEANVLSQFISASAGFIAKFEETETSNADGIFTVTANVTVYSEKLLEAVTFGNDSAEIDREVQEARVGSDIEETREKMTKYVCSYMLDYCRIWGITAKELIPAYDNNGQPILHVNCYFGTTPAKYHMYTARLNSAMARVGAKRTKFSWEGYKNFVPVAYLTNPDNSKNSRDLRNGGLFLWLPRKFLEPGRSFQDEFDKFGYKFTFKLLDAEGNVIQARDIGYALTHWMSVLPIPETGNNGVGNLQLNLLPLKGEHTESCYRRKFHITFNDFASSEELLKVKKMVAAVELVKKVREPTLEIKHGGFCYDKKNGAGWIEH